MRAAYLGPAGTFSEEALVAAAGASPERVPLPTVFDAIVAVARGEVDLALVPFENSIEGSVRATLDALAFDVEGVAVAGEVDHPIRHSLIAARPLELTEITAVLSHPQATAQCARFLREELPGAEVVSAPSTAEAVRRVSEEDGPWAALGPAAAAGRYRCSELRSGVEDAPGNVTRFVWIAPASVEVSGPGPWKTSVVVSEFGNRPGALAELLAEFAAREINVSRIESRPARRALGRYLMFMDLEGAADDGPVAEALTAIGSGARLRVLGSYPTGSPAPPV